MPSSKGFPIVKIENKLDDEVLKSLTETKKELAL